MMSGKHENENHWKGEAVSRWCRSVCYCTRVYGPSHEERGIFLQVPAVACSMHPWDLEDPLFLETFTYCQLLKYSTSVCVCRHQCTLTLFTHFSPGIWQELICSSSHGRILILSTGIVSCEHTHIQIYTQTHTLMTDDISSHRLFSKNVLYYGVLWQFH